jgi:integrase/recombinase XerD
MDAGCHRPVLRKHARAIGLETGYSAHSVRATFVTTTLENGASLEDVQQAVGHRDPGTTKLYDRRRYNPEKSASHRTNYWLALAIWSADQQSYLTAF